MLHIRILGPLKLLPCHWMPGNKKSRKDFMLKYVVCDRVKFQYIEEKRVELTTNDQQAYTAHRFHPQVQVNPWFH